MGDQYRDTGWFSMLFTATLVIFILTNIVRARAGKSLYIRRIPGLNAIDEAVGRATEMGRPVIMVPGIAGLDARTMQAILIFSQVTRIAARFATPILFCCFDAPSYAVAHEIVKDVYQEEGVPERFDEDSVRFISDRQFAFAAGVSGLILREKAAATFFMGYFAAEALILAETANTVGAIQVAASTEYTQTPFFLAACDYVLIGDEFYAASAYLTKKPVLVGSLVGQDWCKLLILAAVALGAINATSTVHTLTNEEYDKTNHLRTVSQRPAKASESLLVHLLIPKPEKVEKVDRPQLSPDELPKGGGDGGGGG